MRILMMLIPDPPGSIAANLSIERVAEPYYQFAAAGIEVVCCSPDGGSPFVARQREPLSEAVTRFLGDRSAREALADTLSLDQVHPDDFEAAFCIGVPSAIWIAGADPASQLIAKFLRAGKAVAVIPSQLNLEPYGSHDGLLIIGERGRAPWMAAQALIGLLQRSPN